MVAPVAPPYVSPPLPRPLPSAPVPLRGGAPYSSLHSTARHKQQDSTRQDEFVDARSIRGPVCLTLFPSVHNRQSGLQQAARPVATVPAQSSKAFTQIKSCVMQPPCSLTLPLALYGSFAAFVVVVTT